MCFTGLQELININRAIKNLAIKINFPSKTFFKTVYDKITNYTFKVYIFLRTYKLYS